MTIPPKPVSFTFSVIHTDTYCTPQLAISRRDLLSTIWSMWSQDIGTSCVSACASPRDVHRAAGWPDVAYTLPFRSLRGKPRTAGCRTMTRFSQMRSMSCVATAKHLDSRHALIKGVGNHQAVDLPAGRLDMASARRFACLARAPVKEKSAFNAWD